MALRYTLGFPDRAALLFKFDKHVTRGREFAYTTPDEYETNADRFLGGPLDADAEECLRTRRDGTAGDTVRYNRNTQEFGVLGADNVIRSYFIPNTARHGWPSNLDYFRNACTEQRD